MVKVKNRSDDGSGGYPKRDPAPHQSVFEAKLLKVELKDTPWDDEDNPGHKKQQFNFRFEVTDGGDFDGRWFWGSTQDFLSPSPANKLRQWVQALLDEDVLPQGFDLETDDLEGLPCRIIVHAKDKFQDDGTFIKTSNWVEEVRASRNLKVGQGPGDLSEEPF